MLDSVRGSFPMNNREKGYNKYGILRDKPTYAKDVHGRGILVDNLKEKVGSILWKK